MIKSTCDLIILQNNKVWCKCLRIIILKWQKCWWWFSKCTSHTILFLLIIITATYYLYIFWVGKNCSEIYFEKNLKHKIDQMVQRTTWELLIAELTLTILACGGSTSNRDSHEKQIKSEFEGEAKYIISYLVCCLIFIRHPAWFLLGLPWFLLGPGHLGSVLLCYIMMSLFAFIAYMM